MYIGQSHNILWRWTAHKSALKNGRCENRHLQAAWNKYGENAFKFKIVELCCVEELDTREEYWISYYDTTHNGYNIRSGGNSSRGWKMNDEGRRHISEGLKGKKKPEWMGKYISERQKRYYETHIPVTSKPVVCLNTGEIFANASAAHRCYPSADNSAIHSQCNGKTRSCGKMEDGKALVWAYLSDYQKMSSEEIEKRLYFVGNTASAAKMKKPVICRETGAIFESCADAAVYAGVSSSSIHDCLHGRSKHSGKHPETGESLSWAWVS